VDLWGRLQHLKSAFVACDTPPLHVDLSFARILSYVRTCPVLRARWCTVGMMRAAACNPLVLSAGCVFGPATWAQLPIHELASELLTDEEGGVA
jgi:hypothetical protein